jgi:hypothetical protein
VTPAQEPAPVSGALSEMERAIWAAAFALRLQTPLSGPDSLREDWPTLRADRALGAAENAVAEYRALHKRYPMLCP